MGFFRIFQVRCRSATVKKRTRENMNAWPKTRRAHNTHRPCNCGSEVSAIVFIFIISPPPMFVLLLLYYFRPNAAPWVIPIYDIIYAVFSENPIVRKNKEQTRKPKSHYFPFICCFFSFSFFFSIRRDLCTLFFLTFILNVIYDSDLRARTGKRDQTNLWCPGTIYPSRGYS